MPDALAAGRARKGIAKARRAVEFLDGRSESPGESLSRLRIHTASLPAPALQYELRTDSGAFVARPDFFWKDPGVVGEFDGRGKYGSDEPGATAETIHREKLREDAIRSLGYEVVRWTWRELFEFDAGAHASTTRPPEHVDGSCHSNGQIQRSVKVASVRCSASTTTELRSPS